VARFLLVPLPLASHLNPALAVAAELAAGGHEVAWCGPESDLRPLLGPAAVVHPTGRRLYRRDSLLGMEAIEKLWDGYLIPFNRFIIDAVERAIADWRPDVLVVDQYAIAAALAAHRCGVRWATLCTGALELTPPLDELPGLEDLVQDRLARVWAMRGLPVGAGIDLRFSPHLVLALTTGALTGSAPLPERCVLVGPALGPRPQAPAFAWDRWDSRRRHVLVTVGTLLEFMADGFYARAAQALAALGQTAQAVFVAEPETLPSPPPGAVVAARVPVLELLPRLDAVICHGGMGTVTETLAHGVPLVVAPIRHDAPAVARQVAAAGAGIEVSFASASAQELARAVSAVLDEPSYRQGAGRVRASFASAGGASAAAARLAALAAEARKHAEGR
jgi:zeaxanthin glucosyltransferase